MPKHNRNIAFLIIILGFLAAFISFMNARFAHGQAGVAHTIEAISSTQARIIWTPDPATTYLNISRLPEDHIAYVGSVTSSIALDGTQGNSFVIQEYKLVGNQLQLIRAWQTNTVPKFEAPTVTPTLEVTATPIMTITPTVDQSHIIPRVRLSLISV